MRTFFTVSALALSLGAGAALAAEAKITRAEAATLMRAVAHLGCSGGRIEVDDDGYEVSDVRCRDGNTYLLTFNRRFDLLEKVED